MAVHAVHEYVKYEWHSDTGTSIVHRSVRKQNPEISVNVQYYLENKRDIIIIRMSKFGSLRKFHVKLLMMTDRDKFHYVNIQSLLRLHGHRGTSKSR